VTAPTIQATAPTTGAVRPPHCPPWCAHHESTGRGSCWAQPIDLRLYPALGRDADDDGERGHLTLLLTHDPAPRYGRRTRTTAIRFDRYPDGEDGGDMDPDEAEIAALSLLSMVALARGDRAAATSYRSTAQSLAAALSRRRNGEPR